jgi:predicted AAA+ superfamily ATPase
MKMNNDYLPRIADKKLKLALQSSGAVLIVGPKWCGKTETAKQFAKSILYMQHPDFAESYLKMASLKPSELLEGETPRLIDEWQDAPILWNAVRFTVDQRKSRGQFILTGSVVPKMVKNMHSGAGRFSRLLMRTMSLFESAESTGEISLTDLFSGKTGMIGTSKLTIDDIAYILLRGGWPETVKGKNAETVMQTVFDYVEAVINDDMSRVDGKKRNPVRVRSLLRSVARHVSSPANNSTILKDLTANDEIISDKTIVDYINTLKKLYVIDDLHVWSVTMRSKTAMRTTPKRYLTDPSIAGVLLGANREKLFHDLNTFGLLFESMAIRDLRVYADSLNGNVFYYRDKLGHEVDAIIELSDGRWGAVEIKMGINEEEKTAENLLKFKKNVNTEKMGTPSFLAIVTATQIAYQRKDGVWVIPLGCLKN